jgi:two-component system, LuxR family, response regulator FixJ
MPIQVLPPDIAKTAPAAPVVFVVDDDDLMRAALQRLLVQAGLKVEQYASGAEFLAQAKLDRHGCLLLDVSMPGMTGLEVQTRLNQLRLGLPVVFLTGSSHIPIAVAAMREGAVDFIEKPFDNDDVVDRVRKAIARDGHQRSDDEDKQAVLQRLNTLTPRECGVMEQVVAGKTSKEIARALGVSPRTVEIHRVHLMEKMSAPTLAALVRMRLLVGESSANPWRCGQTDSPKNTPDKSG